MVCGCSSECNCQDDRDRLWASVSGLRDSVERLTGRVEKIAGQGSASPGSQKEAEAALETYRKDRERKAEEGPAESDPDEWMNH